MSANVELLHSVVGQEPAARSEANDPGRKHRGLWSFLTRTFVLGQLLVAEHFFGNAAQAADGGEGLAREDGRSGSNDNAGSAAASLAAPVLSDEGDATSAINTVQAKTHGSAGPQSASVGETEASARGADMSAQSLGGQQGGGDAAHEEAVAVTDVLGGNLDGVGTILDPVIDVVDVVGDVGEVVNGVVGTVDVVVGNVLDTVHDILPPTLEFVSNTVTGTVDTLVGTVSTATDVAFDAVNGILGSVPVVGEPLTALTGTMQDVASSTLGTANSFVNGAVDGLGQTANTVVAETIPAVGNIVGSGVIPVLQSAVTGVTSPDTLFEGGRYSDFNITLQSEPISGVASNIGSSADNVLDGVTDLIDLPGEPPLHAAANVLDPLKGGLGELFS